MFGSSVWAWHCSIYLIIVVLTRLDFISGLILFRLPRRYIKVYKEKISGQIFKTDRILIDASIFGSVPVKSNTNSTCAGMPDLDPTFELGPVLNITILDNLENCYSLILSLPMRAVFSTNFTG